MSNGFAFAANPYDATPRAAAYPLSTPQAPMSVDMNMDATCIFPSVLVDSLHAENTGVLAAERDQETSRATTRLSRN